MAIFFSIKTKSGCTTTANMVYLSYNQKQNIMNVMIQFRLLADEKAALLQIAKDRGVSLSALVRSLIINSQNQCANEQ